MIEHFLLGRDLAFLTYAMNSAVARPRARRVRGAGDRRHVALARGA